MAARYARTEPLQDPDVQRRAAVLLSSEEIETLARLRPATARRDYLGAHALARTMIGQCIGCPPSMVRLRSSALGQPEIAAPRAARRRLSVSLSHADGLAFSAVSVGCLVGVDVESLDHLGPDPMGVARVICTPGELQALRVLRGPDRALSLLSTWTIKEAIAKATGLGFHLPLTRIGVHSGRGGATRVVFDDVGIDAEELRLASCRLTPRHIAAMAVLGAPRDVRIWIDNDDALFFGPAVLSSDVPIAPAVVRRLAVS